MIGRIVEISNNNRYLSVYRGFLLVKSLGEEASELGRIPLDDILAVVTNAHGLSYSNNFLISLLERDIPLLLPRTNTFRWAFFGLLKVITFKLNVWMRK